MEERERSRSPSRRPSRVEQVVGRWLRRSRDTGSRERILSEGKAGESSGSDQRSYPVRLAVQVLWDPLLGSHGLSLSPQTPILVQDVAPGGPADGRLVPGDQLVKINNVAVDDLTPEQAADIMRECQDSVTMTVLRTIVGPKSSFITPEKRAILRSNPVKVRFAEEVEVNGHSQGNSLLFLPNVLKVYLENGQTKAFKFEPSTTVKDIVMTLKEKLSLSRIEHFSLVLEQLYSITKLLLLHEQERIQQVVQRREAHDYRCLFRVCFMPRDPQDLLQDDPTSFEYLYLQGVNDVLQERFAVEMRCNTALRLAALHIQERLVSCGQNPKTSLKTITRSWGMESFVSSTLLRNMREKDLRKAIAYHMKKSQSLSAPRQRLPSADQARTNYLKELSDLKSYGGKSFSATMMLQDRESTVTLLVGARYGVSQVVNRKLSILSALTEFSGITRIELLPESERVSLVKIYLQDIKPITLLLESVAAKDLSCLVAGYCRLLVDPTVNIFPWTDPTKKHRVSAEEGYVSRCASDSDDSSDLDMDALVTLVSYGGRARPGREGGRDTRREGTGDGGGQKLDERRGTSGQEAHKKAERATEAEERNGENEPLVEAGGEEDRVWKAVGGTTEGETRGGPGIEGGGEETGGVGKEGAEEEEGGEGGGGGELQAGDDQPSVSEASDSCRTDSRFLASLSSDSLDALEEDDFISCSSSAHPLLHLHPHTHPAPHPHLLYPPPPHDHPLFCLAVDPPDASGDAAVPRKGQGGGLKRSGDPLVTLDPVSGDAGFAELSRMADYLPSPPEASEEEEEEEEEERRERVDGASEAGGGGKEDRSARPLSTSASSASSSRLDCVFNFEQSDARCYYNICSNVTPDSGRSPPPRPLPGPAPGEEEQEEEQGGALKPERAPPVLQPPPGFGDSSSDEEFFDASDRFASPEEVASGAAPPDSPGEPREAGRTVSPSDVAISFRDPEREGEEEEEPPREEEEEEEGGGGGGGGGGREMVSILRRRSRKRRSFVETHFTSRVSFPEPHLDQDQRNRAARSDGGQSLSSEPEPSQQSQNPCCTVSSLTHTEGEPTQLESKPILLATPPCRRRDPDQDRRADPGSDFRTASSRARRRDVEMEPDAMETKSVTALVTASVSAVLRRVDPDGKESADRRGDGEEEEEEEEEEEGKEGQEEEEEAGPPFVRGLFGGHMFLAEIKEEDEWGETRGEEEEEEEEARPASPGTEGPPAGADGGLQASGPPPRFAKDREDSEDAPPPGPQIIATSAPGSRDRAPGAARGARRNFSPPSHPPPPPPTCPLPPLPEPSTSPHSVQPEREQGGSRGRDCGMLAHPPKTFPEEEGACGFLTESHGKEAPYSIQSDTTSEAKVDVKAICVPAIAVHSAAEAAACTTSSTVSDGAVASFDSRPVDSEGIASVDLIGASNEATVSTGDRNATAAMATANIEAPCIINSLTANTPLTSNTDFVTSINCTTAKLDAIAGVKSTSVSTDSTVANVKTALSLDFLTVNETADLTKASVEAQASGSAANASAAQASVSLATANASAGLELRKGLLSPTVFLLQPCSPGIIGSRLSASTLRGKIQSLPLYLSRSQETLSQTGLGCTAKGPSGEFDRADPKVAAAPSAGAGDPTDAAAESDDSEVTLTGSEADGEVGVETAGAEIPRSAASEAEEAAEKAATVYGHPDPPPPSLVCEEPGPSDHEPPKMNAPYPKTDSPRLQVDIPEHKIDTSGSKMDISGPKMNCPVLLCPPAISATTQSLNGPGLSFLSLGPPVGGSGVTPSTGHCTPAAGDQGPVKTLGPGCGVFTICEVQPKPQAQPLAQARPGSTPTVKPDLGCGPALASGCESALEGAQAPLGTCGCPAVYTNCFGGGEDSFDDELTVYEFSCRTQSAATRASGTGLPLTTAPLASSFLSTSPLSSSLSPSFPRSLLAPLSSSDEFSPLLSPSEQSPGRFLSEAHGEAVGRALRRRHYPAPPAGFQALRGDVDRLLAVLEGGGAAGGRGGGGRHPRDTCPAHFGENERLLHAEARRLMSGCQRVVRAGQSPGETLLSLADGFQTLAELAATCLRFSGCERCDRRNGEAVSGLADVARAFREFALAAERASGSRACRDLSTKLLAKQCTALTASVFCLTQLFRTLTAL